MKIVEDNTNYCKFIQINYARITIEHLLLHNKDGKVVILMQLEFIMFFHVK